MSVIKFLVFVVICPVVLQPLHAQNNRLPVRYAIIIGVSQYHENHLSLKYADSDACRFERILLQGYLGHFEPSNIKKLIDTDATYGKVSDLVSNWLMSLRDKVQSGDEIYIYYSGHGIIATEEQNITCTNLKFISNSLNTLSANIPLSIVKSAIKPFTQANTGNKVYLIIDACRKNDTSNSTNANVKAEEGSGPGEIMMYSSSNDEFAYESDSLKSGVFTYFFLLGLKGAADINHDNKVTTAELERFVDRNVADYVTFSLKKKNFQSPLFKLYFDSDRNNVLTAVAPDTEKKYTDIYNHITIISNHDSTLKKSIYDLNGKKVPDKILSGSNEGDFIHARVGDSLSVKIYEKLHFSIHENKLIHTSGPSAYDYLQELIKLGNDSLIEKGTSQLFAALLDQSQTTIDNYLAGKLSKANRKVFELAYQELITARSLSRQNSPLNSTIIYKALFLKARSLAGSTSPHDWEIGLRLIDSSLSINPTLPQSYNTKGVLFESKHEYLKAINSYQKANIYAPDWIYPLYNLASSYYDIREYAKSMDYCNKVITKDSSYSLAYSLKGLNYEAVKQYDEAIFWNKYALKIDSTNVDAYYYLGRIYSEINKPNDSLSDHYYKVGAEKYKDIDCLNAIGEKFYTHKNWDLATIYFKRALKIAPFNVSSIENYAYLLDNTGRKKEADLFFYETVKKSDFSAGIYSAYRYFIYQIKSKNAADSLFKVIISINHEDPFIFTDFSEQLEAGGNNFKAKNILDSAKKYFPSSSFISYKIGEFFLRHYADTLLWKSGLDSALFYLNQSSKIDPEYSFVNFVLYKANVLKGDMPLAIKFLDKARSENRYIASITNFNPDFLTLGDDAIHKKNYTKAIAYYRLVNQNENHFETDYKICVAFYLNDQLDSAYNKCVTLTTNFDVDKILELKGLILFDEGKYDLALELFKELDEKYRPLPDYIEQALCLHKSGRENEVKSILLKGKLNNRNAFQSFIDLSEIKYSESFIRNLEILISNENIH